MKKRGRPSAACLSVVTPLPSRLPPPPGLTEAQTKLWCAVTASRPADYFNAADGPTLAAYVRSVVSAERISGAIAALGANLLGTREDLKRFDQLSRLLDREERLMLAMARALRLTQQTRARLLLRRSLLRARGRGRSPAEARKAAMSRPEAAASVPPGPLAKCPGWLLDTTTAPPLLRRMNFRGGILGHCGLVYLAGRFQRARNFNLHARKLGSGDGKARLVPQLSPCLWGGGA